MIISDTAIVIVSYNAENQIIPCLISLQNESLLAQTFVVDNASTDDTVSIVQNEYPEVTLIAQPNNLGFGNANNVGITRALSRGFSSVFLLNQDALIAPGCLTTLCETASSNPQYGVLSPIHYGADPEMLENDFRSFVWSSGIFDDALSAAMKDVYQVSFVNAAAWLITGDCLKTVGGFSPNFFLYGEDVDYCNRLEFYGLKAGIVPGARIRHLREGNALSHSRRFSFQGRRRRSVQEYMWRLINPAEQTWRSAYGLLINIIASLFRGIVSHTFRIAFADLCAWFCCMIRLPELRRVRRKNMRVLEFLWLQDEVNH